MTDSSSIDNELGSLAPTAASILGIKGPLRFRPHGSSQKAHVVLRRVDPESDSEGEGETKGVVQFSLFAYKRIEVKPGKEILLTIADGPFKDRAIIFEGDDLEAPSLSDVEEETQVAEDDDALVPLEQSLPLKMRKPWAKRLEVSVPLAHASPPRATYHSLGVQTDPVNITASILATLTNPLPAPEGGSQSISPALARGGSKPENLETVINSVPSSSLYDSKVELPPVAKTAAQKMGAVHPQHAALNHSLSIMKVDSIASSSTPPSVDMHHPVPSTPTKQDPISVNTYTDVHANDRLKRWSPSVPVPTALPAVMGPSDETSESAHSSSDSEDGNPPAPAPERPWSPSVPAALSTLASRRYNRAGRRVEQPENADSSRETQPSLCTEVSQRRGTATLTSPSPSKSKRPKTMSNSFVLGGSVPGIVGLPPSSSFSDEDSKAGLLPEKISSAPSLAQRLSHSDAILPPVRPVEVPSSPSTQAHSYLPSMKKEHSPSRLSPASSRGSFNHGTLESSATSVPSYPSSPKQSLRKPQTLSWPPFRPDGSADFYPPFRAGPDPSEPPPSFRPTSGPGVIRGHPSLNTPARGRPALISSSNAIPVAPRHAPFIPSSAPGRPSPPAAQPFHNSQPLGPSMSPKTPLKPSHAMIPDNGHPPRQPRSEVAPQAVASPSLGPSTIPKTYSQYPRYPRHPHAPRSLGEGRGRGIPMAAGTKRKVSSPRTEPAVPPEIPPKRPSPSTWPTASPIRCAAVQGEQVAIRAITFNRTGQLMAVTCADCTIRIWDNVTYSEVARLPHSSTVVSAQWMDDDAGVLALYSDGALMRWTRPGSSTPPRAHDVWNGRLLAEPVAVATPEDAPTALAYYGDRIAASFPKFGVYIWTMKQGSWQSQRPIDRQNVTAIKFIDGGTALLGGTKDGVLWYCQVSETVPRVYNFFKARICGIDVLPTGTHALVSQQVGRTHLVAISLDENRGKVMQVYTVEPELQADAVYDANALFVGRNDAVLYGSARGYLFAWDKASARILCGLDHGEGCVVQATGTYRRSEATGESCVVTGSRDGMLNWWAEPLGFASMEPLGKRIKTS